MLLSKIIFYLFQDGCMHMLLRACARVCVVYIHIRAARCIPFEGSTTCRLIACHVVATLLWAY